MDSYWWWWPSIFLAVFVMTAITIKSGALGDWGEDGEPDNEDAPDSAEEEDDEPRLWFRG